VLTGLGIGWARHGCFGNVLGWTWALQGIGLTCHVLIMGSTWHGLAWACADLDIGWAGHSL
jgi:hypothetical protein